MHLLEFVQPTRPRGSFLLKSASMSIVLIGYRGSGKTTLGRRLAEVMRCGFVDLDERIVGSAGKTIREIFAQQGETGFRQMESTQLRAILGLANHVISLGGGAVLAEENRRVIRESKHEVVYLKARPEELHRRITADPATATTRPGLTHLGGSVEEVRNLLTLREPLYRQLRTIELDVTDATTESLVKKLQEQLSK